MKKLLILPLFMSLALTSTAQTTTEQSVEYETKAQQVLATQDDWNYTSSDFEKSLRFTEFVLGTKISEAEKQQRLTETLADFSNNPKVVLQEAKKLGATMQQVYQITDPTTIALIRSSILSQMYSALQKSEEDKPLFLEMVDRYSPILAIDSQIHMAFTENDFQAILKLMRFQSELVGQPFKLNPIQVAQLRKHFVQQFNNSATQLDKQRYCTMQVSYEYLRNVYDNMDLHEKDAFKNNLLEYNVYHMTPVANYEHGEHVLLPVPDYTKTQWPAGVVTKAQKRTYLAKKSQEMQANQFNSVIVNDVLINNHTSMFSVVENMESSGTYWDMRN